MRRGSEFSITVGGEELMNSRRGGSETALGEIACAPLRDQPAPHVLIGGLGMGFTLRAALAALGPAATVTVAELASQVVEWARGPLTQVFMGALDDPRVRIIVGDVQALIQPARAVYDAILLDVDNGPDGLVQTANDGLYGAAGLAAARRALRPGAVLAVWSAAPDAGYRRRLTQAGFAVREHVARSGRSGGARHVIWMASTPPAHARPPVS